MRTRFLFLETDDTSRELPVDIEGFLARDRVSPDNRMDVLHWLAPDHPASLSGARILGLLNTGVDGLQGTKKFDELRGELAQRRDLGSEQGVTPGFGLSEEEEGSYTRRL
jgi:hypothetical protein